MKPILLFIFFVFTLPTQGQLLFPVKDTVTNFYGYKNISTSAWDVPPQFEFASEYRGGFAIVSRDGRFGTINKKGKVIIPITYEILEGERYFFFKKGDSTGILNQQGKMVLKGNLSYVFYDAEKGSALIMKDDMYGYWDTLGNYIQPFSKYELSFEDNMAYFKTERTQGFIQKNGKKIIEVEEEELWDIRPYGFITSKDGKECLYNIKGEKIRKCDVDSVIQMRARVILYRKNNKYGIMDSTGKDILDKDYDYISPFNNQGIAIVKQGDLYGLINESLELIMPLENQKIDEFGMGYNRLFGTYKDYYKFSVFKHQDHYGVINDSGKVVMKPDYDMAMVEGGYLFKFVYKDMFGMHDLRKLQKIKLAEAYEFVYGKTIFCISGNDGTKCGIANKDGKIIVMPEYSSIIPTINGYAVVKNKNGAGIMDSSTKVIVPLIYADILTLNDTYSTEASRLNKGWDGYIYLKTKSNKIGVAKESGKLIMDTVYYNTTPIDNECKCWIAKDKNNKWQMVTTMGKKISVGLDTASLFDEGAAIVEKKYLQGVIDTNGKTLIPIKYAGIQKVSNTLYAVKKDTLWGLIKRNNEFVLKPRFGAQTSFRSGYAFAKENGEWKIIDTIGNIWGYEKVKNISTSTRIRKIHGIDIMTFSYTDIKEIDEISFDLLSDHPNKKVLNLINSMLLQSKEDLLKQKHVLREIKVMFNNTVSSAEEKKFYFGLGVEVLGLTNNFITINNYREKTESGDMKNNEQYITYVVRETGLTQIDLSDIFLSKDYLEKLNVISRGIAVEKKIPLPKKLHPDSLFIDVEKFIITEKGIIFRFKEELFPNLDDYEIPQILIRYRELKDIARILGPLKEFYE